MIDNRYLAFVSVYAPTMPATDDEKLAFYLSFKEVVHTIPRTDKVVILDDFNPRVGKDHDTRNALGRHGVGKCNSNDLLFL